MVRRLPAPKIRHSLWQRLLRRRDRPQRQKARKARATARSVFWGEQPVAPTVPVPFYIHLVRLLIVTLGASAIAGTILSLFQPLSRSPLTAKSPPRTLPKHQPSPVVLKRENIKLKQQLQQLAAQYPQLQLHLLTVNLATGEYVDLQANSSIAAASTIKIPILIALFQQLDRHQLQLSEPLTLEKTMIVGGNGDMAEQPVGTKFTVGDSAIKMIANNDNTATNLLIKRLGGQGQLNAQFHSWGLVNTTMKNPLPDFSGTNVSSPRELATLLQRIEQGQLLSANSRRQVLEILRKTKRNTMLPAGLPPQTKIAHKTGEIANLTADVGLIELTGSQKYVVAAMVVKPHDNHQGTELIRQSSQIIYQGHPTSSPAPSLPSLDN
jgi:beta-lactamase class A